MAEVRKTERRTVEDPTWGINLGTQLRLVSTDGIHWQPYVGITGKALIAAVLREHYPRGADAEDRDRLWVGVITWDYGRNEYTHTQGLVAEVGEAELVFTDGHKVPWDDMVSVEI